MNESPVSFLLNMSRHIPSPLTLRPARIDDAAAIADIHIVARESAPGMPASIHPPEAVHAWVKRTLQSGDATLVAERQGLIVGYARYPGDDQLADLYVQPSEQGRGVGTALLKAVREARAGGLELWVFLSNTAARGFYAHHGFVEVERTDGAGNEEKEPDVRMKWWPPSAGQDQV